MCKLQSLVTSLAIALSATAASAAPTTFTDRSAFQAELGSFTVETFNSFTVETPFHSSPLATPSGLTLSMSAGVSTDSSRNKIDLPPAEFAVFNVNGTALANVLTVAGESFFLSFAAPVFGVGFDLGSFNNDFVRTQVIVNGDTLIPAVADINATRFFGFTSTSAFSIVELRGVDNDGYGMDNVTFGGRAAAVPVPGTLLLTGLALAVLGSLRARRG